jgi:hypothetical protein
MNAISNPGNTSTPTSSTMVNYDNELIDFVEFSNLKFNNKLINKYQERANKSSECLITSLLTLEEGDEDVDEDEVEDDYDSNSNKQVDLNSDEISKYTTYIELEKIIFDKKLLESVIHFNVLNKLEKNYVINWYSNTALFYPIKTLGDGNCLVNYSLLKLSVDLSFHLFFFFSVMLF